MALEFLIQGLERRRLCLEGIALGRQHPHCRVIGRAGVVSVAVIGGRETPELAH
jgi:hypothetical protein